MKEDWSNLTVQERVALISAVVIFVFTVIALSMLVGWAVVAYFVGIGVIAWAVLRVMEHHGG